MKHIVKYNESLRKEDYYKEISNDELNKSLYGKNLTEYFFVEFSTEELKKIKKWSEKYTTYFSVSSGRS